MKNGRIIDLRFLKSLNYNIKSIIAWLKDASLLENKGHCFAFTYFNQLNFGNENTIYSKWPYRSENIVDEFYRQLKSNYILCEGLPIKLQTAHKGNYLFKLIDNREGNLCISYPQFFVVPIGISHAEIIKIAGFRYSRRVPLLSFAMKTDTGIVSLWRSSQNKPGLLNNRCIEDEKLFKLVGELNNLNKEINMHIYDARPYNYAYGNKINGGGFENPAFYKNCEIFFLEIDNIHAVRDSYKKVCDLCTNDPNSSKFLSLLEQSHWLDLLSILLQGAKTLCNSIQKGYSVHVHCTDGWDRTTQLVCLVQIILDPYFRTRKGFSILIEKEFVLCGHQFAVRNGLKLGQEDQRSPIFIQFLDAVHQIIAQFPLSFEFNQKYLSDLAKYCGTGMFGNFICDHEQEMLKTEIYEKSYCIWEWFENNWSVYENKFFEKNDSGFVVPDVSIRSLRLWKENFLYYCRSVNNVYNTEVEYTEENMDLILKEEKKKNHKLQKELDVLKKQLLLKDLLMQNIKKSLI